MGLPPFLVDQGDVYHKPKLQAQIAPGDPRLIVSDN